MNNFVINSNGQVLKDSTISEGAENFEVKTLFYKNVKNPDQVLKKLISGKNSYCVLKAKNILSLFQLQLAIYFTIFNLKNNKLKTKSLEAEIIYSLAPHTKISQAFQEFGIDTKDKSEQGQDLYVIHLTDLSKETNPLSTEVLKEDLDSITEGEYYDISEIPFDEIAKEFSNIESIAKIYGFDPSSYAELDHINQLISLQISTKSV
ncbi:hypothetical protein CONCODRAFT_77751 [Conidiobolus coronatus NRRL 28638]|uniref:EKC/KEOPS complex subunit CGI121 n=1 Tax=Conidiobolus coronatus (strain ATCC 28846 / CBS 209.66 / NRRL 28638) TaxID=796925 RepID=A0A137PC43_CONC2|nr:hypothetical protein CONCODRAFT_77751 [Conidiobolus coronatus NRRL 28638]|eukprot:KXN72570.1 hypothetical protein CONCODRAFT_77751 [Conidiobolus coronatus NRRL 28638]